jgi:deazaflavin-dependent oxidoreductase (nitroreductase family)
VGWLLIRLGLSPRCAVVLEVPGRKSGLVRRTALVRVELGGSRYLVSLSGESEWVRNVRAAAGRAVVGRRRRCAVVLVEVPPAERPAVIRAYLRRAGRTGRSRGAANEARYYFGVAADPSMQELTAVADRYPVFRIVEPQRDRRADVRTIARASVDARDDLRGQDRATHSRSRSRASRSTSSGSASTVG